MMQPLLLAEARDSAMPVQEHRVSSVTSEDSMRSSTPVGEEQSSAADRDYPDAAQCLYYFMDHHYTAR